MLEILSDHCTLGSLFSFLVIGLPTIILLYNYSIRNHDYFEKRQIPYVKPFPFFGSVLQNLQRPVQDTENMRYQSLGPVYGHFEGNNALLSIADPDLLRDIFVKDFQFFTCRRNFSTGQKIVDLMISVVQGEDWKRIRTIITPTFSTGKIKRMLGIFKECSSSVVKNFQEASEKGEDIEAKELYGAFSMDVIASSAFSTKIDSHRNPGNPFVQAARKVFSQSINFRVVLYLLSPWLSKLFKIAVMDPTSISFFENVTLQIIKERKITGQTRNDFLQMLLDTAEEVSKEQKKEVPEDSKVEDLLDNYGDEPNTDHHIFKTYNFGKKSLSMDELVAQCVVFFIAGYETTGSTLAFCSYAMALHQDVQQKLREEVDHVLRENGGELTYEGVQQMKYLDNVISETLRVYPPAIRLERVADADYELGDTGITIPKGMIITIPAYAMHRDPKYFPDPEKFDPDRFTTEEKAKREQYAYIPFGAGPRNCVGMRFALMEVKVCLAYVIANFHIKKSANTKVPLEYKIGQGVLQAKEMRIKMEKRENCLLIK